MPVPQSLSLWGLLSSGVVWALLTSIPLTRLPILAEVWDTLKEEEVALKVWGCCEGILLSL
jgi:hypothetical protein